MAKKKPVNDDETTVAPVTTVDPVTPAENGVDLQDTALAGIEGKLVAVNHTTGLNLRKSPHYMGEIAEVLPDGAVLMELDLPHGAEVEGWALVHTGHHTGWVDRRYIVNLEG